LPPDVDGLAFRHAPPGQATPMDISAPEPPKPAMPRGDYTKVG
jgi:hypothetical protein